jgi:hypothetical protein
MYPSVLNGSSILYECGDDLEEDEIENYQCIAKKTIEELHI